ncbi:MAG: MerR family transcriptional regulator [Ornithinimicrobium sp.]
MLTISRLADYAGVTVTVAVAVAAVRHYHKIGLLPEPRRDHSGYRRYDAAAVVRLIRIHTLASAGVPLGRVKGLLDADPERFTEGVRDIDKRLRAQVRHLQETRKRLARLATGDQMALPASVVSNLDRLRGLGIDEQYVQRERDAWIMVAAQIPEQIDAVIAQKHTDLDDPEMVRLYTLLSGALDWSAHDPRVVEVADILDRIAARAAKAGRSHADWFDGSFVAPLDATMAESAPAVKRLLTLLEQRGWMGWTRLERIHTE